VADALDTSALERWRRDPTEFITEILHDPETGRPFILFEAERRFLEHAFKTGANGRLQYPEQVYGAPKKPARRRSRPCTWSPPL
jgi:hypothetical protein